jgi:hypothetical protein
LLKKGYCRSSSRGKAESRKLKAEIRKREFGVEGGREAGSERIAGWARAAGDGDASHREATTGERGDGDVVAAL